MLKYDNEEEEMIKKNITILSGDGIGPEIMAQGIKILDTIERKYGYLFELDIQRMGAVAIAADGNPLPMATMESCLDSDAVLLAAIGDPAYDNDPDLSMRPEQGLLGLRKAMKLYTNIRPVQTSPSLAHLSQIKSVENNAIDLVIYRELSSGIYYGKRSEGGETDEATDECYYNRQEIERIAKSAFEAAGVRSKKLCLVDKANVLATSRLWRKVVNEMSASYPEVELDHLFVDNAAMQMVLNPAQFDVILCGNMFGDIISDLASTIPGSLGLLPSASLGKGNALFEPVHGSYPQATGLNIANPIAMIRSVAMMMTYFDFHEAARDIELAIQACFEQGFGTPDLHTEHQMATTELGNMIALIMEEGVEQINFRKYHQTIGTVI